MSETITLEDVEMPFTIEVVRDEADSVCIVSISLFGEELSIEQTLAFIDAYDMDELFETLTVIISEEEYKYV